MQSVSETILAAVDWLGVPRDITLWEMVNSELITAAIIGSVGYFLNRKVNRLSEKQEAAAAVAAYEHELEDMAAPGDSLSVPSFPLEEAAATPAPDMSRTASPGEGVGITEDTTPASVLSHHEKAAEVVSAAKNLVDEILKRQTDGRKRRKYANIGKRDYRMRVLAARDDDLIGDKAAMSLLGLFEAWRPHRTGRKPATPEVVATLRRHLDTAERETAALRGARRR